MPGILASNAALITGGGRGIGRATALALARAGCDIVLVARTPREVDAAAAEASAYGVRTLGITADITDAAQLDDAAEKAATFGPISILVNNAGSAPPRRPHARIASADVSATLATCLEAPLQLCRLLLPGMLSRRRGWIVNVASASALRPRAGEAAYAAAKAGLLAFSRALYAEVRDAGVKVIAVLPGYVDTALVPPNRRIDRTTFLQPADVAAAIVTAVTGPAHGCSTEIILEPQADPDVPRGNR